MGNLGPWGVSGADLDINALPLAFECMYGRQALRDEKCHRDSCGYTCALPRQLACVVAIATSISLCLFFLGVGEETE